MAERAPTGIDLASFARWAATALPQFRAPFTAEIIAGGQSNITAHLTDADGREFVVRRPPLHGVLPTAHDMGREHRIIDALGPTPVPVPEALAFCADPDVIGAPFYVMSYVDGIVLNDIVTAEAELDDAARAHSGESLVDALVALHAVDVDAVGLGDLARRDELIARQLKRWHAQFEASKTARRPGRRSCPRAAAGTDSGADARAPSCTATSASATASSTTGARSGRSSTGRSARSATRAPTSATSSRPGPSPATRSAPTTTTPRSHPGSRRATALLERYAERSGRDVEAIPYFVAFSFWRLACILEGVLSRIISGARGDADVDVDYFRRRVESCAQLAEEYAAGL